MIRIPVCAARVLIVFLVCATLPAAAALPEPDMILFGSVTNPDQSPLEVGEVSIARAGSVLQSVPLGEPGRANQFVLRLPLFFLDNTEDDSNLPERAARVGP